MPEAARSTWSSVSVDSASHHPTRGASSSTTHLLAFEVEENKFTHIICTYTHLHTVYMYAVIHNKEPWVSLQNRFTIHSCLTFEQCLTSLILLI